MGMSADNPYALEKQIDVFLCKGAKFGTETSPLTAQDLFNSGVRYRGCNSGRTTEDRHGFERGESAVVNG
jgi:hypothetical protein